VPVLASHIYILIGRNSALSNHHALVDEQGRDRVGVDDAIAVERSVLAFVTPGRKRKERYGEATIPSLETGDPEEMRPHPLTAYSFSSDDLVIIPSQDSQEVSEKEHLANMMGQWGLMVNTLNHSTSVVKRLQTTIAGDLDALDARIVGVKADLGNVPSNSASGDCISAWDGLLLLHNGAESIATENTGMKEALQGWEQAEGKLRKSFLEVQQVLRTQMDQALGEFQTSLTDLTVLVKLLGSEQEKMTEKVLQMHSTQGATGPREDKVKELRELVGWSLSGPTSMQVASLEAKIILLEALLRSTSLPIHSTSSMML
jgi:hypothetical protein